MPLGHAPKRKPKSGLGTSRKAAPRGGGVVPSVLGPNNAHRNLPGPVDGRPAAASAPLD